MTLFTGITHSMSREVNRVSPRGGISQSRIAGVASALPEYRYPQEAITAALKHHWNGSLARPELLDRLHTRAGVERSEEHTSELQSLRHLVCRLLLEKKKRSISVALNGAL